jgi:hypothetical protein
MERRSISDAAIDWPALIAHVEQDRVIVEIERDQKVVANITPAIPVLHVSDLNLALSKIPLLGDESSSFGKDLEEIRRSIPAEKNLWD